MVAVPKLSRECGRLANATAMDYCSRGPWYSRKACISVWEACVRYRGLSFGTRNDERRL